MSWTQTTLVRLEDGRGCWRHVPLGELDLCEEMDGLHVAYRFRDQTWRGVLFYLTGERVDGYPVLSARVPAIAPGAAVYSPLHLPAGWHAPEAPCGPSFRSLTRPRKK